MYMYIFLLQQLYNLSPEPDRKEFLDKLFDYMAKKGVHQKKEGSNYFFFMLQGLLSHEYQSWPNSH